MENDAIIFDIDGTLWDACLATVAGWQGGLNKLEIQKRITVEQIKNKVGHTQKEILEIVFPGLMQRYPDLLKTINDYEAASIKRDGGIFYVGVIDGIRKLASYYKIFIVSNCADWYMDALLDFSGLRPFVAGFDCNGLSNLPKGEMLLKMKNDFSLKNPVYVGDTASDEEAARLSEMDFIHVSYGFGKPKGKAKTFGSFERLVGYFIDGSC
jgi:phosphoglycolate phosphatase